MPFMDFMDYLSSKYMLPIGGMLTAIFVLKKWGISNYLAELKNGMGGKSFPPQLVKAILTIAAAIVAFILFNEVYAEIFGKALIG
jgi:SNF family Na+-dependent transporter